MQVYHKALFLAPFCFFYSSINLPDNIIRQLAIFADGTIHAWAKLMNCLKKSDLQLNFKRIFVQLHNGMEMARFF